MQRFPAILILGPTASGKTPLGDLLETKGLRVRRCRHFDFGANLRSVASSGSPVPGMSPEDVNFIRGVLMSGALLENEQFHIAEKIFRNFTKSRGAAVDDLIIMDGLPRHAGQAEDVSRLVSMEAVIELSCPLETILERIRSNAGGDRSGRQDDDPGMVKRKLDVYLERTAGLMDYYDSRGVRTIRIPVGRGTTGDEILARVESEF
ncbi:MAG TPA: nucleoside monophosphate kinase [Candidatus Brocadiia bacterium]|nr:nucleoside monophosphate kinase [Candidatus Brocadiia bacterium]